MLKKNLKQFSLLALCFFSTNLFANLPDWVKEPNKVCEKKYICVVGVGSGVLRAQANARAEISKLFKAKITSTYSQEVSESGGEVSMDLSEEIEESTDNTLSGISIDKRHETETDVYVLAKLNKFKASRAFKDQVKELDEQIKALLKDKLLTSYKLVETLLIKRNTFGNYYSFLTNLTLKAPISFAELKDLQLESVKGIKVLLKSSDDSNSSIESLASEISKLGIELIKEESNATHIIALSKKTEKMYLKVKGFEKYKVEVVLKAKLISGVETGVVKKSYVGMGRTKEQAIEKANVLFHNDLSKLLEELNIK